MSILCFGILLLNGIPLATIIKNSLNYYTTTQIETISKVHRHTSFVKVCSGLMRRRHCASAGDERSLIRHAPELIAPEYGRVWMMVWFLLIIEIDWLLLTGSFVLWVPLFNNFIKFHLFCYTLLTLTLNIFIVILKF